MTTTNYEKHRSQNPIQRLMIGNFEKSQVTLLSNNTYDTVLDVGCGEGFGMDLLRQNAIGKHWLGVDAIDEALELGKEQFPDLKMQKASAYKLPFKESTFDLVMSTEVLEHLQDPEKAVKEMMRVAKKYIFLSVPREPWFRLTNLARGKYVKALGNHPEHINHWSINSFKKLLEEVGLKIEAVATPYPWIQVLAFKK